MSKTASRQSRGIEGNDRLLTLRIGRPDEGRKGQTRMRKSSLFLFLSPVGIQMAISLTLSPFCFRSGDCFLLTRFCSALPKPVQFLLMGKKLLISLIEDNLPFSVFSISACVHRCCSRLCSNSMADMICTSFSCA